MQGVKGEALRHTQDKAVVSYADPLTTQQMLYHPAKGGKGKQHGCFSSFLDITRSEFHKIVQISRGERL
jgi:hypothetical protein